MFAARATLACLASALVVSACASGGSDTTSGSLAPSSLSLPKMPELPSASSIAAAVTPAPTAPPPAGTATEIYSRVARGAMSCWFGGSGPLKADYIYHAEADAPSRGGKAEIVVHVREPAQPNPRGPKAYRVNIDPTSETAAAVKTENLKMPDPMANAMTDDVGRWARGDQGCAGTSTASGWGTADPAAAKAEAATTSKATKPAKTAAVKVPTKAAAKPAAKSAAPAKAAAPAKP